MSNYTYLAHHGTKGMKWYHRLYQNTDGSLTPLGRAHYGVGEARKKAVAAIKKSPETIGKVVKNTPKAVNQTMRDIAQTRREHVRINRTERKRRKAEKAKKTREAYEAEMAAKIEKQRLKLLKKESRKTLREIADQIDEANTNRMRNRVDRLLAKRERAVERAELKAQEKYLKKTAKRAEKDAKRAINQQRLNNREIKNLSDDELDARINRLKKEATLRGLETERMAPMTSAGAKWVANIVKTGVENAGRQVIGAKATSIGKRTLGLTDEEISEFIRLTKKK